jgi:tryptophanase
MRTIIEPFRIKMTEPLKITTPEERRRALETAHHNVFLVDADDCCIDLLTDSGTGAMSTHQWAAMMLGESYAGSRSWKRFEQSVRTITGMEHVLPTHQGRAAEGILAECVIKEGHVIPNNSHFDTTRANIEYRRGVALNLPCAEAYDTERIAPFKGNMDVGALRRCIAEHGREAIPFAMVTVTNNTGAGSRCRWPTCARSRRCWRRTGSR